MKPKPEQPTHGDAAETSLPPAPQPATVEPVLAPITPSQPSNPNGLAIAALIVGIVAFLTGILGIGALIGVVGVLLGSISLIKHKGGEAMAIIAICLSAIAIAVGGFIILLLIGASSMLQSPLGTEFQDQRIQDSQAPSDVQSDFPTE